MKWTRFFGARPHLNRTSDRLTSRQISGQPSTLCLSQISLSPGRQTDVPYRSQTGKLRTKHFSCLSLRFSTATSSHSTWLHLNHKCFGGPWSAQVGDRQSRSQASSASSQNNLSETYLRKPFPRNIYSSFLFIQYITFHYSVELYMVVVCLWWGCSISDILECLFLCEKQLSHARVILHFQPMWFVKFHKTALICK